MNRPPLRHQALSVARTLSFLPVLAGFVIGSLPILLPLTLYRWLSGRTG